MYIHILNTLVDKRNKIIAILLFNNKSHSFANINSTLLLTSNIIQVFHFLNCVIGKFLKLQTLTIMYQHLIKDKKMYKIN